MYVISWEPYIYSRRRRKTCMFEQVPPEFRTVWSNMGGKYRVIYTVTPRLGRKRDFVANIVLFKEKKMLIGVKDKPPSVCSCRWCDCARVCLPDVLCIGRGCVCCCKKVEVLHYEWAGSSPAMQSLNPVQTGDVPTYPFNKAHARARVIWLRGSFIQREACKMLSYCLFWNLWVTPSPDAVRNSSFLSEKGDWVQFSVFSISVNYHN